MKCMRARLSATARRRGLGELRADLGEEAQLHQRPARSASRRTTDRRARRTPPAPAANPREAACAPRADVRVRQQDETRRPATGRRQIDRLRRRPAADERARFASRKSAGPTHRRWPDAGHAEIVSSSGRQRAADADARDRRAIRAAGSRESCGNAARPRSADRRTRAAAAAKHRKTRERSGARTAGWSAYSGPEHRQRLARARPGPSAPCSGRNSRRRGPLRRRGTRGAAPRSFASSRGPRWSCRSRRARRPSRHRREGRGRSPPAPASVARPKLARGARSLAMTVCGIRPRCSEVALREGAKSAQHRRCTLPVELVS